MPDKGGLRANLPSYPEEWSESSVELVADVNPESLGVSTSPSYSFRYIDLSSVSDGVIDWNLVSEQSFSTAPSRARRVVRPGDVLLGTVRPALQSHAFADWNCPGEYVCSTGFAVLRAKHTFLPRFLFQLLFGNAIASQLRRFETGSTYPAVNESDVHLLRVPLPAIEEQQRIAQVVDTVDAAIQKTEALIHKLKMMKAGLLHDLLTCGLDENGELRDPVAHPEQFKDSALGRVPKEWEVVSLGETLRELYRYPTYYGIQYVEGGVPEVRGELIGEDGVLEPRPELYRYISEETAARFPRVRLEPNDFVMSVRGTLGKVAMVPSHLQGAVITANLIRIQFDESIVLPSWARHFLHSKAFQDRLDLQTSATTIKTVQAPVLRSILVERPTDVEEQKRIAVVLDAHNNHIHAEGIYCNKLKQLKSGLMDDLLTGRVRVKVPEKEGAK